MNTSLATSFIVGGILLISMLSLNNTVTQHSSKSTMELMNTNSIDLIAELLENDFQKLGQGIPAGMDPFVLIQDDHFKFRSDAFYDDNRPFSIITWRARTNQDYNETENPNDFVLERKDNASGGSGNSDLTFPVTHFKIRYFDLAGNEVANPQSNKDKVRRIRVELAIQSPSPVGSNNYYRERIWTKDFYPENLQFANQ